MRFIESTTDSQEVLEKTFANEGELEKEEEPSEAPSAEAPSANTEEESEASAEPEAKEDQQEGEDSESEHEEKPKRVRGGYKKKISRLTREKYELEAKLREYEQKLAGTHAEETKQQPESGIQKPRADQFSTYEEYVEALADWKFQQKMIEAQAAAERQKAEAEARRQQEELKSKLDTYRAKVDEAVERYEDWDEVMNKNVLVPEAASIAIIESENGPDIAYYLGKNPEVIEELHELSPVQQIAKIVKIGNELAGKYNRRPLTKAPAPVNPVAGSPRGGETLVPNPSYKELRRRWLQERYS